MKYFSMFSGVGGFELGIQEAVPDAKCVGFSEVDKWAVSIYNKQFEGHKNYGDATKIKTSELPEFDCLVGGFPCQAFSIAGKRQGFSDTRGTLFFEIARIAREKQPRFLVLENVKGLLSHDQGRSAAVILSTLDEIGYDVQWNVHNSKNHGVPQNRERVFIIAHLRVVGQSAKQIFPISEGNGSTTRVSSDKANKQVKINCVGNINPSRNGANGNVFNPTGLSPTLTTNKGEGLKVVCFNAERGFRDKDPNPKRGGDSGILSRDDGIYYALTKTHANHPVQVVGGSQGGRVYDPMGIAATQSALGSGGGAKTGLYAVSVRTPDGPNKRIRRLMPVECERLQGFPDKFTQYGADGEKISDSQRYKCCGNAVTVNVVAAIFTKLER